MQVSGRLTRIQTGIENSCQALVRTGSRMEHWIADRFHQIGTGFKERVWDKANIKERDFYKRHIEKIKVTDFLIVGGGMVIAAVITAATVAIFGIALLPIGVCVGSLFPIGAFIYAHHNVRAAFNAKYAWKPVNDIRETAKNINTSNRHFEQITEHVNELKKPLFSHLKDKVKELESKIETFKKDVERNSRDASFEDTKKAFLKYLEGVLYELNPNGNVTPYPSPTPPNEIPEENRNPSVADNPEALSTNGTVPASAIFPAPTTPVPGVNVEINEQPS